MSLTGKFVHIVDAEHYRTGEVAEEVSPSIYLIKYDSPNGGPPGLPRMVLASTEQIVASEMEDWSFFDSKEQLQLWVDWLEHFPRTLHHLERQRNDFGVRLR